ncbi:MAG: hypothetical protein KKC76_16130 [Proteobacteria bacterium]|nr:hypothetical protein [Pseudomonadota bacterium]MBU4294699.1 hypothetical protein [Pseudomonadota bacterium]MCG2749784.1 DUF6484 domain-containing protein [Desulfobulbaceae bacterium]
MKRIKAENIHHVDFSRQMEGVRTGRVTGIEDGRPLVDYSGNTQGPLAARFAGSLDPVVLRRAAEDGSEVLLAFEKNDPACPVILDILQARISEAEQQEEISFTPDELPELTIDGKKIAFEAREEIVLRCGKASITLTKAGKVIIRGAYVLNRSSGVNRIKGGSVQIN